MTETSNSSTSSITQGKGITLQTYPAPAFEWIDDIPELYPWKILQILPANGWKSVYADISEEGDPIFDRRPLVCFGIEEGLISMPSDRKATTWYKELITHVVGFDICDGHVQKSLQDEPGSGFLGYEAPGEEDDEEWNELLLEFWELWHEYTYKKSQKKSQKVG